MNMYFSQCRIEVIHSHAYSLLIDHLTCISGSLKKRMKRTIVTSKSVGAIGGWMAEHFNSAKHSLAERIFAAACVEAISFCSAFAVIYNLKRQGKIDVLCQANELIAEDEMLHAKHGAALYSVLKKEDDSFEQLDPDVATEMVKLCVKATSLLLTDDDAEMIGLKNEDMISYIKSVANSVFKTFFTSSEVQVPYPDTVNPFMWMAALGVPHLKNFFESRETNYIVSTDQIDHSALDDCDDFDF